MLANNKKVNGRKVNLLKWWLWIPWLIAIIILFIRAGGILDVDFFFFIRNGVSLTEPYTYMIYYGIVLLVVALSFIMGKRAFCHCICWMAPFMVIGTKVSDWLKIPGLHLVANKSNCIGCKKCSEKCPMSLEVKEMVESERMKNAECILCGECIDSCPKKVIAYSFKGRNL
jgi:polyferredoxin